MAYECNGSQLEYIEVPLQKPRKIYRRKALLGSRERIHLVFVPDSLEEVSQDSKVEAKSDVLKELRLPRRHHQLAGVEGASAGTKVVIASKCLVARRRSSPPPPPSQALHGNEASGLAFAPCMSFVGVHKAAVYVMASPFLRCLRRRGETPAKVECLVNRT